MKIKTITCHDVYNVGASLQAYALSEYLRQQGHDVEIIDYKPDYLSRRYKWNVVDNPRYEKPFLLKIIYLFLKFPKRLLERPGKIKFDQFRKNYLRLTGRYTSLEELRAHPPVADLYIAGSDQIWNTLFQNGKDGAFYLDFGSERTRKVSYAASFATEEIAFEWQEKIRDWLSRLDRISVREKSGLELLGQLGIQGRLVLDPVFLLTAGQWKAMINKEKTVKGIFVYDFDRSALMEKVSCLIRKKTGRKIYSFFRTSYADECLCYPGPLEFLHAVYYADHVVSNSFHATVFSLIWHKDFYVIKRQENINTRLEDMLALVGLEDRLIVQEEDLDKVRAIHWEKVDQILEEERDNSFSFLRECLIEIET